MTIRRTLMLLVVILVCSGQKCPVPPGALDGLSGGQEPGGSNDSCGDGICSETEKLDRSQCPGDCVGAYANLDADIAAVLQRDDNLSYAVDPIKRGAAIETVKAFAATIGINAEEALADGMTKVAKVETEGELTAIYRMEEADPQGSHLGDQNESVFARKTWGRSPGSGQPLSDDAVWALAEGALAEYGLPATSEGDRAFQASTLQARQVDDDVTTAYLRQKAKYYRKIGTRPVANSTLTVDIDPITSSVVGMSVRNWWGVGPGTTTPLKTAVQLKHDVLEAVAQNAGSSYDVYITSCRPSYYQLPAELIPSLTVTAVLKQDDKVLSTSPIAVNVSMITAKPLEEHNTYGGIPAIEERGPLTGITLTRENDATTDPHFAAYYSTAEARFYTGSSRFHELFGYIWQSDGLLWSYDTYFKDYETSYVDAVDLIFVTGHGGVKFFEGYNDADIYLNSASANVPSLGPVDLEYFTSTFCLTASAVYCDGMKATKRYTQSSSRNSIFQGLHIYSGHHGSALSSKDILYTKATYYAQYLGLGMTLIEAWCEAVNDQSDWYDDVEDGCHSISSPDSNCNCGEFTCDRYTAYPACFYIKGKQNETIYNRVSYSSDPAPGDSSYDVDLIYYYQTSTVPIYSSGYSLP